MKDRRQWIPAAGLLAVMAAAVYMVIQLDAQTPIATGDYSSAAVAEVHDSQGQVVLRGQFAVAADEDEDEVERKAPLQPAGADRDASGEAEVEYARVAPAQQEVEFSVQNVEPGATYTFVIDGHEIGKAAANDKGVAELELDVKAAGKQ